MNHPHHSWQLALLGKALPVVLLVFVGCERLPDPSITELVDLESSGPASSIVLEGTPGNYHYENRSGQVLFEGRSFFEAQQFHGGYAVVSEKTDGHLRHGVIDSKGRTAIPIIHYTPIFSYENGLFKTGVFRDHAGQLELDKIGYFDSTGASVIPAEYSATHGIDGDLVILQNSEGKWGILNRRGQEIAPFEYSEIGAWEGDRAAVAIDEGGTAKWGYIDRSGQRIIPCEFGFATAFDQGIALVQKAGKYALIDLQGKPLTAFEYDDFQMVAEEIPHSSQHPDLPLQTKLRLRDENGKVRVQKEGKWQLIIDN